MKKKKQRSVENSRSEAEKTAKLPSSLRGEARGKRRTRRAKTKNETCSLLFFHSERARNSIVSQTERKQRKAERQVKWKMEMEVELVGDEVTSAFSPRQYVCVRERESRRLA